VHAKLVMYQTKRICLFFKKYMGIKNSLYLTIVNDEECEEWKSWSQVFRIDHDTYMFDYFAYVVVAVCIILN